MKVDNPSRLHTVFEALCAQSKAIVYVFDLSLESDFLHAARHVDAHRDWSFGVKRDPGGYLIYLVDEDRDDSPTSMVEFLSYNIRPVEKDPCVEMSLDAARTSACATGGGVEG